MSVPTYNNTIRFDDWPKPGEAFSSRFISNYAEKVRQDFNFLNGGLSLRDNMNGAVVTMSMAHGVPVLVASPLRNNATPIGALALSCDTQQIPNLSLSTSAVVNSVTVTAPSGSLWLTAKYPVPSGGNYQSISRLQSNSIALSTNTAANVGTTANITVGPGIWLLSAIVGFVGATTTTWIRFDGSISSTSATLSNANTLAMPLSGEIRITHRLSNGAFTSNAQDWNVVIPPITLSVPSGSTATRYLVALSTFAVSTMGAYGFMDARQIDWDSSINANVTIYFAGA